jgi:hypothetical protein
MQVDGTELSKPSDPNDLSAYNLDGYDEEVSRGTGELSIYISCAAWRHSLMYETRTNVWVSSCRLSLGTQQWELSRI